MASPITSTLRVGTVSRLSGGALLKISRGGGIAAFPKAVRAGTDQKSRYWSRRRTSRHRAAAAGAADIRQIEELRRGGSADAKQHRRRDCQRNQRPLPVKTPFLGLLYTVLTAQTKKPAPTRPSSQITDTCATVLRCTSVH